MNFPIKEASSWAESMFGNSDLGDKRLTKRLIQMATQLSANTGSSLLESSAGDDALIEGGYRFLRNKRVTAAQIAEGGYAVTASLAQESELLLALEDSTSLSYQHEVRDELGYTGNNLNAKSRGYIVHSTMLLDAKTEHTIGLVAQKRWCRDETDFRKRNLIKKRAYEEKESYKWEQNSLDISARLGKKISDVISVCDREADIYEYLQYKIDNQERFIVRGFLKRKLASSSETLLNEIAQAEEVGRYSFDICQKGGRTARQVEISLKVKTVTLTPPQRQQSQRQLVPLTLNVI